MKKKKMIEYLIIFENMSWKEVFKNFVNYIVIFSIIIAFCLLMPVYKNKEVCNYENSKYDYWAQCLTKNQINEISKKEFVESVFPFSLMSVKELKNIRNNKSSEVMLIVSESFNNMDISSFTPKNCITMDKKIIEDEKANPIILDYSLSKIIGASIGDKIEIPFGKSKKKTEFIVGAIYQSHNVFSRYDAMIVWKDPQAEAYGGQAEQGHDMVYIKGKDSIQLKKFMDKEFFPELTYEKARKSGQFKNEDEIKESYKDLDTTLFYESREDQLNYVIESMKYTPAIIIITTVLGCIIFIILLYREENKKMTELMYTISLLYSLGFSKRRIQMLYIKKIFVNIIPSCFIALLLQKFVIYKYFAGDLFIPWYLLMKYGMILMSLIIISVLITSHMLIRKVKTEKISFYLYDK